MNILLDPVFLAVSLGHLGVDLLNGTVPVLLAFLSTPLGLSNTMVGGIVTLYAIVGALSQPFFGYISDQYGPRWVIGISILLMALAYSFGVTLPGFGLIGFLVIASFGSGAFHPAGTMQATMVGRTRSVAKETTSTSYFFLLGQIGLFLGPVLAGLLLALYGLRGILLLTIPAIPIGIFALMRVPGRTKEANSTAAKNGLGMKLVLSTLGQQKRLVIGIMLLAALRIWVQSNMTTFMPKYLADLGFLPALYGLIASLYMGGSAIGNVLGGSLADIHGKRKVARLTLAMAVIPLALIPIVDDIKWFYLLVPLAGLLGGATHSIVVVFAQGLIPGGMGLASGLILGFMFASGALGTVISGMIADQVGIPFVFGMSAILALLASGMTYVLNQPK